MTNYDVKVVIESENRVNLISDICDKVNEEKIIIGGIKSHRCNSVFRIELTITVADKGQLDRIMAKLPTVPECHIGISQLRQERPFPEINKQQKSSL